MNNFDVAIIGSGVAGTFSLFKILKDYPDARIAVFDAGRPPLKRRHQLFGFLGCLPGSDGKLYIDDFYSVVQATTTKKAQTAQKWVTDNFITLCGTELIKTNKPSINVQKKIKKLDFNLLLHNYYQIYPKEIHQFSRHISNLLDNNRNNFCSFDNEVNRILKNKNNFCIITNNGEFTAKKVIMCTGRGGWRWVADLFAAFGIIDDNNIAKFGIRAEITSSCIKDFNDSSCSLHYKDLEIGPLSWYGTVIPEDHIDLALTSFRSNEQRWKTDKVSFNILMKQRFNDNAYQQADRIGKLTFILGNDRVFKEKISTLIANKSKISMIPEYRALPEYLELINELIPDFSDRGYFYVPTIEALPPRVNLTSGLSTEINGMLCAGEAAGIKGLWGAMLSGVIAADTACKE